MPLQFQLPANLTADKLISELNNNENIQFVSRHYCLKTCYDSFDWRLWRNGLLCEFIRSKSEANVQLRTIRQGKLVACCEIPEIPSFTKQLPAGPVCDILLPILQSRALLTICTFEYEVQLYNLLNEDQKIVLRFKIEDYDQCHNRIVLEPIKGYDEEAKRFASLLSKSFNLNSSSKTLLQEALALQGRKPKDYSDKLKIELAPSLRASAAAKKILRRLLKILKANEAGAIADIDSEFLHDFRVSVRKTRTVLNQLKLALPETIVKDYAEFFAWLGQITSPTRDLDVYLEHFDDYQRCLPVGQQDDLMPFYDLLIAKKRTAHMEMVKNLQSPNYRATLSKWEQYLKHSAEEPDFSGNVAGMRFASKRIWKLYQLVLKQGSNITSESSSEELHRLRKTCKKFRYLMEFFQSYYSEHEVKPLMKKLKDLQDVLGNFQDFCVQEQALKEFSEELIAGSAPAKTFIAMGILIQSLDQKKLENRKLFSAKFSRFKQKKLQSAFKSLLR